MKLVVFAQLPDQGAVRGVAEVDTHSEVAASRYRYFRIRPSGQASRMDIDGRPEDIR
jgi:hypothetical protein